MNKNMRFGRSCAWTGILLLGMATGWAQNHPPVVSNVTASQRTDASRLVDIYYTLADADGDSCTVWAVVSDDGGATWAVPITAVSGAVGPGIIPGSGKHIIWDCAADLPGVSGTQFMVRICADDVQTPGGMVSVPAGEFEMGDPWNEGHSDERPVHDVYLSPYSIDKCDVTNQQYCDGLNWAWGQGGLIEVRSGVVYKAADSEPYCDTHSANSESRIHWDGSTFTVTPGKEDHPMVRVSWYGSVAYCNWRSAMEGKPLCYDLSTWECDFSVAGYRLPTEAEWEKAAGWDPAQQRHFRFCEHTDGCGYNCLNGQRANYSDSGDPFDNGTTPVGYYDGTDHGGTYPTQNAQSYYGCYDMSGNVWKWCNDWYSSTYYQSSPPSNPTGPETGTRRVLRGGNWNLDPNYCRSAGRRGWDWPGRLHGCYGFRCALGTPTGLRTRMPPITVGGSVSGESESDSGSSGC